MRFSQSTFALMILVLFIILVVVLYILFGDVL